MPLRWSADPLKDPTGPKRGFVNPFIDALRQGFATGNLPVLYGPAVAAHKGRWRDLLPPSAASSSARLIVEIGAHKGIVLSALATDHPQDLILGVDITFKRVVTSAKRAVALGLRNVHSIMANARAIREVFADDEVDGLVIFFPDPWPKQRHSKNRLLSEEFCRNALAVLKPGGFLWLKTDQASYFEMACQNMDLAGFVPVDDHPIQERTYTSAFEQRFAAQGLATYGRMWQKLPARC